MFIGDDGEIVTSLLDDQGSTVVARLRDASLRDDLQFLVDPVRAFIYRKGLIHYYLLSYSTTDFQLESTPLDQPPLSILSLPPNWHSQYT